MLKTETVQMKDIEAIVTLNTTQNIGPVLANKLKIAFGSFEAVEKSDIRQIYRIEGISQKLAKDIVDAFKKGAGKRELDSARKEDIQVITFVEPNYPTELLSIYDYPIVIYIKGKLSNNEKAIAIVGTRQCTSYGKFQAEYFSSELAKRGFCIVSGLARGIDTIAHKGALKARGKTIAVLGSGVKSIYPPENKNMSEIIWKNGALISEFPIYSQAVEKNFPRRNRLISALSQGVLVVEAGEKSGALLTAYNALEQGKDVFAIPGNINSKKSYGCNALIKSGAILVQNIDDITNELQMWKR